jgi:hypothetical protein
MDSSLVYRVYIEQQFCVRNHDGYWHKSCVRVSHEKELRKNMPKYKRKKRRASLNPSQKTPRLKEPPMKEIEDTVLVVNKLVQNVAKMTRTQRTRFSIMLTHAMLGVGMEDLVRRQRRQP